MLEKYRKIVVEDFLRDYRDNKAKLAELQKEKEYLLSPAGIDTTRDSVRSGTPSSPVEAAAIARERLDRKIAELDEYFRAFDAAMEFLDETDEAIIRAFYIEKHPSALAATLHLGQLGYSDRAIRARREKAIRRLYEFFN